MKIRPKTTSLALAALLTALPAGAQTAGGTESEAREYIQTQCPGNSFLVVGDSAIMVDDDGDVAILQLEAIDEVGLDSDYDPVMYCRSATNPFASSDARVACINWLNYGGSSRSGAYLSGCNDALGASKAIHTIIKQHNPSVKYNAGNIERYPDEVEIIR